MQLVAKRSGGLAAHHFKISPSPVENLIPSDHRATVYLHACVSD